MSGSLRGLDAHQRHRLQTSIYDPNGERARAAEARRQAEAKTDFDLLKQAHRFIRDEDDDEDDLDVDGQPSGSTSAQGASSSALARQTDKDRLYAETLARRYEASLFKEFALVDLKHYKSGRIALRWRTPEEVVGSIGEETCGSLRCAYHTFDPAHPPPALNTFELPFAYEEDGRARSAMVKVVVCRRCSKKLSYNRPTSAPADGARSRSHSRSRSRSRSPVRSSKGNGRSRSESHRRGDDGERERERQRGAERGRDDEPDRRRARDERRPRGQEDRDRPSSGRRTSRRHDSPS